MAKRLFDILVSAVALTVLCACHPPGGDRHPAQQPSTIFYRAAAPAGTASRLPCSNCAPHARQPGPAPSAITGAKNPRVFFFGALLRLLKVDELPQFYDVLRGKMSLVGPRPEDPRHRPRSLRPRAPRNAARPPGPDQSGQSVRLHARRCTALAGADPELAYAEKLLPVKLALEAVYVREANFWYDLSILSAPPLVIGLIAGGRRQFRDPPEMRRLGRIVPARMPGFPEAVTRRVPAAERKRLPDHVTKTNSSRPASRGGRYQPPVDPAKGAPSWNNPPHCPLRRRLSLSPRSAARGTNWRT